MSKITKDAMTIKTVILASLIAFILGGITCFFLHPYWCNNRAVTYSLKSTPLHDTIQLPSSHSDNIIAAIPEDHSECWGSLFAVVGNDTLRIDSANSCKGIYKNISISHKPIIREDNARPEIIPPNRPAKATDDCLRGSNPMQVIADMLPAPISNAGYELKFKSMINPSLSGLYFGAELTAWFHRLGVVIEPFFVIRKTSFTFLGLGIQYRLLP